MISNHQGRSAALEHVLHAISAQPLLSASHERALAQRARAGDEPARSALVCSNLRQVYRVACAHRNLGVPLEDLVHEGVVGLLEASHHFDASRDVRFFTYASFFVRRTMVQAITRGARTVRLPRHLSSRLRRLKHAEEKLIAHLGRKPSREELAKELGVTAHDVEAMAATPVPYECSLDEPLSPGNRTTRGDVLAAEHARPEERLIDEETDRQLREALSRLPVRERDVLYRRFGLGGHEPRTLRDVGADMNLSKERVRQLESRARRALHAQLATPEARPASVRPAGTSARTGRPLAAASAPSR